MGLKHLLNRCLNGVWMYREERTETMFLLLLFIQRILQVLEKVVHSMYSPNWQYMLLVYQHIYCLLGDYINCTTYYQNQNNRMVFWM